jgi:hypothetical protein
VTMPPHSSPHAPAVHGAPHAVSARSSQRRQRVGEVMSLPRARGQGRQSLAGRARRSPRSSSAHGLVLPADLAGARAAAPPRPSLRLCVAKDGASCGHLSTSAQPGAEPPATRSRSPRQGRAGRGAWQPPHGACRQPGRSSPQSSAGAHRRRETSLPTAMAEVLRAAVMVAN